MITMNNFIKALFFLLVVVSNNAIGKTEFDKSSSQVLADVQSTDIEVARSVMHNFVYDRIEERDKDGLKIIDYGLVHKDDEIRQLGLAGLSRLTLLNSLKPESVTNMNELYPIMEAFNNTSYKERLYVLADDRDGATRVGALQTLLLGYGADRRLELKILEKLSSETHKTKKRNLVRTLGMGKFTSSDTKEALITLLDNDRGEAAAVAAEVIVSVFPKDINLIPKILTLAESDELYTEGSLISILSGYEHGLIPYQSRINALINGIDERIASGKASVNFIRHAKRLKNNVISLDKKITAMKKRISNSEEKDFTSIGTSAVDLQTPKPVVPEVEHAPESTNSIDGRLWYLALGIFILLIAVGVLVRSRR